MIKVKDYPLQLLLSAISYGWYDIFWRTKLEQKEYEKEDNSVFQEINVFISFTDN